MIKNNWAKKERVVRKEIASASFSLGNGGGRILYLGMEILARVTPLHSGGSPPGPLIGFHSSYASAHRWHPQGALIWAPAYTPNYDSTCSCSLSAVLFQGGDQQRREPKKRAELKVIQRSAHATDLPQNSREAELPHAKGEAGSWDACQRC